MYCFKRQLYHPKMIKEDNYNVFIQINIFITLTDIINRRKQLFIHILSIDL